MNKEKISQRKFFKKDKGRNSKTIQETSVGELVSSIEYLPQFKALKHFQIRHFIFSKNVKIGIKCSIAVPDTSHKDKQRHCKTIALFFCYHSSQIA